MFGILVFIWQRAKRDCEQMCGTEWHGESVVVRVSNVYGSDELVQHLENKLGIHVGETTPDGKFSLVRVECLGSCGTAPMLQLNDDYHEDLTLDQVDRLLDGLD